MAVQISRKGFGRLPDGTAVDLFVLDNGRGLQVSVTSYGAIITSVQAPDRNGTRGEVTLGHDSIQPLLARHPYYGAFVGRVANRISDGGFTLAGTRYDVVNNNGGVHLHGGERGFDRFVYEAETEERDDGVFVHFRRTSPDGEEGYPGNLAVRRSVGVTDDMRLVLEFEATTDKTTVVNLTDHTYWNLGEPTIMDHEVQLNADAYVEVTDAIPTGKTPAVDDSPFDFRTYKPVRRDFEDVLKTGANGFDHSWVIKGWDAGDTSRLLEAGRARCAATGREMIVRTTYPAVQFYSGNFLPGQTGRDGSTLTGQEALCMECQYYPDSPNRPEFPSIELRPGAVYNHRTEHEFRTF